MLSNLTQKITDTHNVVKEKKSTMLRTTPAGLVRSTLLALFELETWA